MSNAAVEIDQAPESYHALPEHVVLERLRTTSHGLEEAEAQRRMQLYGPNRLPEPATRSVLLRFLAQFNNLLIYVLLAAAALAAVIGHFADAAVVLAVVIVNAVIGYVQEGRAEQALAAIRAMIDPHATVMRDGHRSIIAADAIVPGDIVLLEPGDRVPADLRLLRARNLRIDESTLTGESLPVEKSPRPCAVDAALADRSSMAFSGSFVSAGTAAGIAVATGAASELGRIGTLVRTVETLTTPLVAQSNRLARVLTLIILLCSVAVFALAVLVRGYDWQEAFMVVIGLAVAAIPEGLPAVMTIALAIGVRRMAAQNAIIRRLPAVETLGSVSVICSDKTGTLTRNEMMVRTLLTREGRFEVTGDGYTPVGEMRLGGRTIETAGHPTVVEAARASVLCNDAELHHAGTHWSVLGDPMEGALLSFGGKAGLEPSSLRRELGRSDEIPFDTQHRYMATLHHNSANATSFACIKGAPERVLAMCDRELTAEGQQALNPEFWQKGTREIAASGQRVLALAVKHFLQGADGLRVADVEEGATLIGLVGLMDPPRQEAAAAIRECRAAGIRVKMITGDHLDTAEAIARELNLDPDLRAISGQALDRLDDTSLQDVARDYAVFARTTPEHKLRLVEALQARNEVAAMTGDGVNDAPALKRANVGVAMGGKGTEAAKEAAELVLADDNFATIVAAVREGRTVYDNLRKMIAWTLPTNGGEASAIVAAILFGLTLPVTALQILWINMVTATTLGLVFAFEPTEPGTMRRPPRDPREPFLTGRLLWQIGFVSLLFVAGAFGVFSFALARGLSLEVARTMVVNTIVVMEIFYLFNVRYIHGTSLTFRGIAGTPAVLLAVGLVIVAQLAFTYLPAMQDLFATAPVDLFDGALIIAVGMSLFLIVEAEKRAFHAWSRNDGP